VHLKIADLKVRTTDRSSSADLQVRNAHDTPKI
jgi:hypothetical protein